jgi:hypothetical protein
MIAPAVLDHREKAAKVMFCQGFGHWDLLHRPHIDGTPGQRRPKYA